MGHVRILFATAIAGAILIAVSLIAPVGNQGPAFAAPAGLSRHNDLSAIQLVQGKPKSETVKQKVKRIWRNLTGYKFDVACPAFPIVLSVTRCTATGKDREDARAKCQSQYMLCQVKEAKH